MLITCITGAPEGLNCIHLGRDSPYAIKNLQPKKKTWEERRYKILIFEAALRCSNRFSLSSLMAGLDGTAYDQKKRLFGTGKQSGIATPNVCIICSFVKKTHCRL